MVCTPRKTLLTLSLVTLASACAAMEQQILPPNFYASKMISSDEPVMLVKLASHHAEPLYAKLGPEVLAALGFKPLTKEEWTAKIEKFIKEHDREFVIIDKAINEPIGMIGIENIDKEGPNHNMVAGWLTRSEWGKHKFPAALRLLAIYFFDTFPQQHRLQALTLPSNERVLKMAHKMGLSAQETTFKNQKYIRLIYKKRF